MQAAQVFDGEVHLGAVIVAQPLLLLVRHCTQVPAPPQYGVEENWVQSESRVQAAHVYDGEIHLGAVIVVHPLLSLVLHALQPSSLQ